jgi:lipoprotein-anchoring transpeptidase ErfK/SrfK
MQYRSRPAVPNPILQTRKPERKSIPLWVIIGGMISMGLAGAVCLFGTLAVIYFSQPRVAAGVRIGEIAVGGKTLESAAQTLRENFNSGSVTLADGERKWLLSYSELGVTVDVDATIQQASRARPDETLSPVFDINLNQAQTAFINLNDLVNVPPAPPQPGRMMDIPAMLERLLVDVTGELADGVFELDMIEIEPPAEQSSPASGITGPTTTHIVERGQELALIARQYGITTHEIIAANNITNPDLIYVGQQLVIPAAGIYMPSAAEAPPAPIFTGKSIVISIEKQRIYAYENGQLVRSHLVSTGRARTPTVLGDYRIYVKHVKTNMRGPDYFLPDVPYTMYFHAGYGIHGTYWHNSFGRPMSNGCVNLPTHEAEWFFNWAEVGTHVRVI